MDGIFACFLKQQSSITQLVPGFEHGKKYRVRIWANARNSSPPCVYPTPILRIELGGVEIESGIAVPAVDAKEVYSTPFVQITASQLFIPHSSEPHQLVIEQLATGDPTLLIDRVVIDEVTSLGGS